MYNELIRVLHRTYQRQGETKLGKEKHGYFWLEKENLPRHFRPSSLPFAPLDLSPFCLGRLSKIQWLLCQYTKFAVFTSQVSISIIDLSNSGCFIVGCDVYQAI